MRYFYFLILFLIPVFLEAATIQGRMNARFKGEIFYLHGGYIDSIVLILDSNGFFSETLPLTEPDIFFLRVRKNNNLLIKLAIAPEDNITIIVDNGFKCIGSQENDKLISYEEQAKLIFKNRSETLSNSFMAENGMADPAKIKKFNAQIDSIKFECSKELNDWVIAQPGFIASVASVQHAFNCHPDRDITLMDTILYNYKKKYPKTQLTYRLEQMIDDYKRVAFGAIAPDFELRQSNGKKFKLRNVKSDYVLLYFWETGCRKCVEQNNELIKNYQLHKDKGLTIVGISMKYTKEAWIQNIRSNHYKWVNVFELTDWKFSTYLLYGIYPRNNPHFFLLDKDHKIIAKEKEVKNIGEKLVGFVK